MALIAFMIDLALQSFDLLSQLQNQSILYQGLSPSCHSPECRVVMPFVSGLFLHFQRLPFSCWGNSTMHALLQPLLLLSFTTTSLYSKVTVFLIFTSVSLGFLMLHKRCIFSSSWQSSLLSFETCKLGVCSCLTVGTWVIPWLPQGFLWYLVQSFIATLRGGCDSFYFINEVYKGEIICRR